MILMDTGPIVALFDRDDQYHSICVEVLKEIRDSLVTTWPVLTECFYLLNFSWQVQDDLWTFLERGGAEIYALERENRMRCRELMKQYQDLAMDLADASLVALGEDTGISKIFTLDQKDFSIYRLKNRKRFRLLPSPED